MFYHNYCGGQLLANIAKNVIFLVTFGLEDDTLISGKGDIFLREKYATPSDTSFYCPTCKKDVEKEDIRAICFNCGKMLELDEAFVGITDKIILDKECAEKLDIKLGKSLKEISARILIKQ